jgi:hypothetical protein
MKQSLINALSAIIQALRESGKLETAQFFATAREIAHSEGAGDKNRLIESLTRLETSGSMTQYANFTHHEEKLWEDVYESAKSWKSFLIKGK